MSATIQILPYERFFSSRLVGEAIRLFQGERLLVLQPFGWHIDGQHIPNMAEQYSREFVCHSLGVEVVCDFGEYVAVVQKLPAPPRPEGA